MRNLAGYNGKIAVKCAHGTPDPRSGLEALATAYGRRTSGAGKLPYIVVLVDEFRRSDDDRRQKVEELIARLAQKARGGIHLVLATQRPSVDVSGQTWANPDASSPFTWVNSYVTN